MKYMVSTASIRSTAFPLQLVIIPLAVLSSLTHWQKFCFVHGSYDERTRTVVPRTLPLPHVQIPISPFLGKSPHHHHSMGNHAWTKFVNE